MLLDTLFVYIKLLFQSPRLNDTTIVILNETICLKKKKNFSDDNISAKKKVLITYTRTRLNEFIMFDIKMNLMMACG